MDELDIFSAASELVTPEEREKFLDEACGDSPALRERIEALLRSSDKVSHFMESPAPRTPGCSPEATIDLPITEGPSTVIGPYKLLQQIGEGGFGVVFMADQTEPVKRQVALKIIKPGMDTRQVIARFEAERQALAMMDHPNIAKVLDAGTTDSGLPYFVMELIKGVPITQYCDEKQLMPRQRLELFVPVCQAIQHAHQKGIIHRDIKPSNVLVAEYDDQAVPKIIDFGVAKAINQRLTEKTMFTQLGQLVGTFDYMSPEQAKLNQMDIDTRSDIYSLGVLLYELLTGDTPFDRERLRSAAFDELLRIIREEEPPRPSARLNSSNALPSIAANRHIEPKKLGTLVRGELDWIVMKALEKDRGRRYDSSHNLAADVERFLSNQPVEAHPPSTAYRVRKFVRRYRVPVMTALLVLAAMIVGGIGTTTGWISSIQKQVELEKEVEERSAAELRATEETKRANIAVHEKESLLDDVKEESAQRQRLLYIADMDLAKRALEFGDLRRLETLLRRHVPSGNQEDLRGFEWFYLWRHWKRESDTQVVLPSLSRKFWTWLALSSDGSRLAVGNPYGRAITLFDMNTQKELDSFGAGPLPWGGVGLTISTDGKTVVYRSPRRDTKVSTEDREGGSVIVRNVETRDERSIDTTSVFSSVALSPDLRTLAIGNLDGAIWLWDLESWERMATLQGHTGQVFALAFSPDGSSLASGSDGRTVQVWNVTTRQSLWEGTGNSGGILSVAYSPGGKFIATGGRDKLAVIWDANTGERLQTLGGARDEIRVIAFSRDEKFLAAGCREGTVRVWRLPNFEEHGTISDFSGLYGLAFLPDGNLVFSGQDGRIIVRRIQATRHGVLSAGTSSDRGPRAAFSSEGNILCATDTKSPEIVHLWEFMEDGTHKLDPILLKCNAAAIAVSCSNLLAIGDSDSVTVYLFDLLTREPMGSLTAPRKVGTVCATFSPTGKRMAIGCEDGNVIVWDVESRQVLMDRPAHKGGVRGVCFSGNETVLLTGGLDGLAQLWNVEQDGLIHSFDKHPTVIQAVGTNDDGNIMATGTFPRDSSIRLYHRAKPKPFAILHGHSGAVRGIKIFRDSRTLASAGGDRTVRLWDLATHEQRFVFDGGDCIFQFLKLSPDERTLAAGGRDGTIRIYRAASPEEVKAAPGWWRVAERE